MKGMFLLSKGAIEDLYSFTPYDYGPFDTQVYRDLESLERDALIVAERASGGSRKRLYHATSKGCAVAAEVRRAMADNLVREVETTKDLVTSMGFTDLLTYVYNQYPAFAVRSRLRR